MCGNLEFVLRRALWISPKLAREFFGSLTIKVSLNVLKKPRYLRLDVSLETTLATI